MIQRNYSTLVSILPALAIVANGVGCSSTNYRDLTDIENDKVQLYLDAFEKQAPIFVEVLDHAKPLFDEKGNPSWSVSPPYLT